MDDVVVGWCGEGLVGIVMRKKGLLVECGEVLIYCSSVDGGRKVRDYGWEVFSCDDDEEEEEERLIRYNGIVAGNIKTAIPSKVHLMGLKLSK